MISPTTVTIEGFGVVAGDKHLVRDVSLRLEPGRVTALVGASGSGKTTIARALLNETAPGLVTEGTVEVRGPRRRGAVAYVPQHPATALNPARQLGAVLAELARNGPARVPRQRVKATVEEALARVSLPDWNELARRYPHQISGGQQQRLLLAHALLVGAGVLVADEPTTGQDTLSRATVASLLIGLARDGMGLLLLSHDMALVRAIADEVIVLDRGHVVERGPTAEVFERPQHPYTFRMVTPADRTGRPPTRCPPHPVLEVRNLSAEHVRPRRVEVLHNVSLHIGAAERVAVLGQSGSGKTTLARVLCGLHRHWTGTVELEGEPLAAGIKHRQAAQVAAVQYVFQDPRSSMVSDRPALAQVARGRERLRGQSAPEARRAALEVLEATGLSAETVNRVAGSMSGGELQRAALARALVVEPKVLLCDEITSGLDPVARTNLVDLLRHRVARQALVLVTHDLAVAAALADRFIVMDGGRVVEEGPAAQLLTDPQHPVTRRLLDHTDLPASDISAPPPP